jgi:MtrB/PioB family decaheme-associated outer membrane protein
MTTNTNGFTARVSVAAVRGALIAMALAAYTGNAVAQSGQELTKPTSTTELGAGGVSDGSYKAGEYNGLEKKGGFFLGNIDLRGGGAFNSDSALRWRIKGTDLGLDSRSVAAEVGVQGKFRINFGFDQLRRNRSDSYQTPYNGAGTNILTLPASWLVPTVAGVSGTNSATNVVSARGLVPTIGDARYINTITTSPTVGTLLTPNSAQTALVDAAAAADLPLFKNFDVYTKRTSYDAGFSINMTQQWGFDASFRPEHKNGTKLMGTVSRNPGLTGAVTDISTVIPDLIDTDTNQFNASLNFKSGKAFAQAAYYGSFFKNNVPFMSWQNWATANGTGGTVNTMSSTPDNSFNQFSVTGRYSISPTTKVVATGSYGRNTQNVTFLKDVTTPVVPVSSLNGLVVSEAFGATFTTKPVKKLSLAAAYKYDNRDNRTPVNIFQYADAGELPTVNANFPASATNTLGAVIAQNANANRPYSRKLNQLNVDADYAVAKGQWIKGAYEYQKIDRSCPGAWIDCADAAITNENTLRAEWRANLNGAFSGKVSYAYSARRAPNYNEDAFLALVPYANVIPAGQTLSAYQAMIRDGLTGFGPVQGFNGGFVDSTFFPNNSYLPQALYANNNRIVEVIGMRRYYVADRNRNKVRTSLNAQANEQLSFQGGFDYNKDDYPTSIFGLQNAKGWAAHLDATYALDNDVSINVFYTYDDQRSGSAGTGNTSNANSNTAALNGLTALSGNSGCDTYTTLQQRNNNNKVDPCLNWFTDMSDKVNTLGFGLSAKNLMSPRLDLTANFILSQAKSDNNVTGGNWVNNPYALPGAASTTVATYFIPAAPLPTVSTDSAEVRLNGRFTIDKRQSVRLVYSYLRMTSSDWIYEGMQIGNGTIAGVLPSNEQAFNYSVSVLGVSYIFSF